MTAAESLSASAPALAFHGLAIGYGGRTILAGLDGVLRRGGRLALVGPNGAGKSTLLKAIAGEAEVLAGRIELGASRGALAYLPQIVEIDRDFPIGVSDFIGLGAWRRTGPWGAIGTAERRRIAAALGRVGLSGLERRPIGTLSGGQMQRALFGRLIVQDAAVILLDEPFAGMDEETVADLLELVREWGREGRTVLAALHDLRHVRAAFDRLLLLAQGRATWDAVALHVEAGP